MIRHLFFSVAAGTLLAACGFGEDGAGLVDEDDLSRIESEVPDEAETLSPTEQAEAETGDAEATMQRWATAMRARNWEAARRVWGEKGEASGLSAEEFAEANDKFRTVNISIEDGRAEGTAGTLYYEAQITMEGELQNGDAYLMKGPVVLSRVNDVPGASDEESSWHIETSDLRPRPVDQDEADGEE
jgi:hypothetical protein